MNLLKRMYCARGECRTKWSKCCVLVSAMHGVVLLYMRQGKEFVCFRAETMGLSNGDIIALQDMKCAVGPLLGVLVGPSSFSGFMCCVLMRAFQGAGPCKAPNNM